MGSAHRDRFDAIVCGLVDRLEEPKFRAEVSQLMEMVGNYVKHGLLDEDIMFDAWITAVIQLWERLETLGVIALHRQALGPGIWENYEALYQRGRRWLQQPGTTGMFAPPSGMPARTERNEVVADAPAA